MQPLTPEIPDILSRQDLFRGLNSSELERLASDGRKVRYQRNNLLFTKGDSPQGLHIVIMGQIKLFLPNPQGGEKVIHLCGPGSSFGEAMVFLDRPYPVSALAMQDSIVVILNKATLLDAIDNSSAIARKMLASLSQRLHELIGAMESCTQRSGVQRVICHLMQLSPVGANVFEVSLNSSKQTLASQLNLAPETLSRVFGQLSEAGLITVNGRIIQVHDKEALLHFNG
jgi:CRP-like cAMP-binding protein